MGQWQIESLRTAHDRNVFDCGQESLNEWLRQRAGQWDRKEMVRCYVAVPAGQSRVVGFYAICSHHVSYEVPESDPPCLTDIFFGEASMPWPLASQFSTMVQQPRLAFRDPRLRACRIERNSLNQPRLWAGRFAVVYKALAKGNLDDVPPLEQLVAALRLQNGHAP